MDYNNVWEDLLTFIERNQDDIYCTVPYHNRKHKMHPQVEFSEELQQPVISLINENDEKIIEVIEKQVDLIDITVYRQKAIIEYTIVRNKFDENVFGGNIYITTNKMREEKNNIPTRPRIKRGVATKTTRDSKK